jgi:hypothetical protein
MRTRQFPFAKYREWGTTPESKPELDVGLIADLTSFQSDVYRKPILDDITGYYQFYPSMNGAMSYATRAASRRDVVRESIEAGDTLEEKRKRQILHIAESAEMATAVFWATATMRYDVVTHALSSIADIAEKGSNEKLSDDVVAYASDAIADYGYCLVNPVQIDHTGNDHGKNLGAQIERVAPGVRISLLEFGKYADTHPEALQSYEGIVALQATAIEQERRINHWAPRHQAVVDAFPDIDISKEVLNLSVDLPELFSSHQSIKRGL